MTEFSGKRVVVMGLGRFGGGAGVARYAAERGASVVVSDRGRADDLTAGIEMIADLIGDGRVRLSLGGHDEGDLAGADMLIVNPAVPRPWENGFIARAVDSGIAIETEIGLAVDRVRTEMGAAGSVIGVTGSVGKSTTCGMIHHGLCALGVRSALGGNIGGSLLGSSDGPVPGCVVVLELSSAMLYWLERTRPNWGPGVGVLTGFETNHLDWHGDEAHYRASKQWLLGSLANTDPASSGAAAVLGAGVSGWETPAGVERLGGGWPEGAPLMLPGAHNRANAGLAVAAIGAATGLPAGRIARAVGSFPGLPHRLACCGVRRGVACYNDSKSTTPGTTVAAVRALEERHGRIWLIAGGADKGVDLSAIAQLDVAGVFTIGTTGPLLASAARRMGRDAEECGALERAVERATRRASAGDALLLSPGCASWDQFANYEARGDAFVALVGAHLGARDA